VRTTRFFDAFEEMAALREKVEFRKWNPGAPDAEPSGHDGRYGQALRG